MVVEELLQLLVGEVDAELLEGVVLDGGGRRGGGSRERVGGEQ